MGSPSTFIGAKPSRSAKIVITNLPPSVEEAELHDALQEYGSVESVRITRRPNGESAGIAYVQFEKVEGAQKAHDALQGAAIKGQEIKVDSFRMPNERMELPPGFIAVEAPDGAVLPPIEELSQFFSQFGEISDIFQIQAYTIVNFTNPQATIAASMFKHERVTVLPALRWSVQQDLLREVERRKVYVCDLFGN
jgi:RNA recognition motif-containing protein